MGERRYLGGNDNLAGRIVCVTVRESLLSLVRSTSVDLGLATQIKGGCACGLLVRYLYSSGRKTLGGTVELLWAADETVAPGPPEVDRH